MNKLTRVLLLVIGLFAFGKTGFSQDIHFSQFYMSPLNLNPALTGVMDCNIRVIANYRNQWASVLKSNAFNTYSASYEQKIPVGRADYFGLGGAFWGDRAGSIDFSTLMGHLSVSFSKRMGGDRNSAHYLVFGADAGIAQRSIDFLKARYGNQAVNGKYCETCESFETIDRPNFIWGDVNMGLLWFSVLDKQTNFYVGAAFNHLNQADVSFRVDSTTAVNLYSKYTIHGGGEFPIDPSITLIPGVVSFIQGPSFQVNGGTSVRFDLSQGPYDNNSFQVGLWLRLVNHYKWGAQQEVDPTLVSEDATLGADALILSTRFDYDNFGIGFSYDINISSLRAATNANGAFELSLIYNICGKERRGVYCPRF